MSCLIKLENLSKIYVTNQHSVTVLKNLNFTLQEAEFVALLGASGSGKSSLLNILGCLDLHYSGDYYFQGHLLKDYDEKALTQIRCQDIGFVFQSFHLISHYTALQNVALPLLHQGFSRQEAFLRATFQLSDLGLRDRQDHLPAELSGGEKQRVAVARALLGEPKLILADEPTGNLDSQSASQVLELFKVIHAKGKSILLVTHDMKIAANAQRIVSLRDGLMTEGVIL